MMFFIIIVLNAKKLTVKNGETEMWKHTMCFQKYHLSDNMTYRFDNFLFLGTTPIYYRPKIFILPGWIIPEILHFLQTQ